MHKLFFLGAGLTLSLASAMSLAKPQPAGAADPIYDGDVVFPGKPNTQGASFVNSFTVGKKATLDFQGFISVQDTSEKVSGTIKELAGQITSMEATINLNDITGSPQSMTGFNSKRINMINTKLNFNGSNVLLQAEEDFSLSDTRVNLNGGKAQIIAGNFFMINADTNSLEVTPTEQVVFKDMSLYNSFIYNEGISDVQIGAGHLDLYKSAIDLQAVGNNKNPAKLTMLVGLLTLNDSVLSLGQGTVDYAVADVEVFGHSKIVFDKGAADKDFKIKNGSVVLGNGSTLDLTNYGGTTIRASNAYRLDGNGDKNTLVLQAPEQGKETALVLGGTLNGNVKGETGTVIGVSSGLGNITGNVEGVPNIVFKDVNTSLASTFRGTLSGVKIIAVNGGSLNVNHAKVGTIETLRVNDGTVRFDRDFAVSTQLDAIRSNVNLNSDVLKVGTFNAVDSAINVGLKSLETTLLGLYGTSQLNLSIAALDQYGTVKTATLDFGHYDEKTSSVISSDNHTVALKVSVANGVLKRDESQEFALIAVTNAPAGNFKTVVANNRRYAVEATDKFGTYKVTGIATAADVVEDLGGSADNAATAEAWLGDSTDFGSHATANAVANKLNELSQFDESGDKYLAAVTALAPAKAPVVNLHAREGVNGILNVISNRMDGLSIASVSTGTRLEASAADVLATYEQLLADNGKLRDVNPTVNASAVVSAKHSAKTRGLWAQFIYNYASYDGGHNKGDFDSDSTGVVVGFDYQFTDSMLLGISSAYTSGDIDGGKDRDTDVDTTSLTLYGFYRISDNFYARADLGYHRGNYEEKKNVAGIRVKGDYDVDTIALQALVGYHLNDIFTPEGGLRYLNIQQDAYTDGAGQRISGNTTDIVTAVVGLKAARDFKMNSGMVLVPEAKINLAYDLSDSKTNSRVTLLNGAVYTIRGEEMDDFAAELQAGLNMKFVNDVQVKVGMSAELRGDYYGLSGLLEARWRF